MSPKTVVGIVTRNRASLLARAIRSAQAQRGTSLRVSVVDDGSTDATPSLRSAYPTVEWKVADSLGYMAARNAWMSSADEDYFVSLDDDAWFLDGDEVATAIDLLERSPDIAAIAFDILSPERADRADRQAPRRTHQFIGCGHVLRLAAIRQVGVYEETPGRYGGEEKDLCMRLIDAGYHIVMLPGVHVWHERTPAARIVADQHCSGVCNDLVLTLRRAPSVVLIPALIAKVCKHVLFSMRHELTRPCLSGLAMFVRTIPATWHTRKPIQLRTLRTYLHLSS